jgi:endoglucanase
MEFALIKYTALYLNCGMRFIIFFLLISATVFAQGNFIALNQEGLYSREKKLAILVGSTTEKKFFVIKPEKNDTVFIGNIGNEMASRNSSLTCRALDLSAVTQSGKYIIAIPGVNNSYPFAISDFPLRSTAIASLKAFYYQRVSMPLEERYAGKWARPAGHPDINVLVHASAATALRKEGTVLSSPGGWYDAGDYNKYIVNSGITMGTMFSAYEDFADYFNKLPTNIPESANKIPDIIDELLYNLRWMLTMQDTDGGVYHKCTNAAFDGMVMPGITQLPRYMVQKSTAASLDFAAVTAQAARVLKKFPELLPGLADSCIIASLKAYNWAIANSNVLYDQDEMNKKFEPKIATGAYGDGRLGDEWLWASSELYISTGDEKYASAIHKYLPQTGGLNSWSNVSMMGVYSLIRNDHALPPASKAMVGQMKQALVHFADSLLGNARTNAFHTVMGGSAKDFEWGSSAVAANQGILLINAFLVSEDKKYPEAALSNADYLLGRNATGYCFITGAGTKSTMKPHHRPSIADGITDPVPGLVAGGPNPGKQDGCTYMFSEPETCYLDDDCSYASNEIAINWNAPVVYLLNSLNYLFARIH